ncbi:glycosyltransferase [Sulfuriroseicoccus oceanibius]|uniref:Glycosyltransferase n=1 Tax=Sulfuriroseicoccus oceanibius TaxID=2707525 RepID=A0A6B3L1T1_9BACT|nr:hypothetical protein [Sulfuriroseicoccus oceanibius]QQL44311.1 glycosyltransferase [Sulfuriroseicoccus oceanibius]
MGSLLIVGKVPPPVGGVTIHVQRLLDSLVRDETAHSFYDLSSFSPVSFARAVLSASVVHLNLSNSYLLFFMTVLCKLLGRTSILTYHGNVGRWGAFRNFLDRVTLSMCSIPLVLNDASFSMVGRWNLNVQLVSAFLPPVGGEKLPDAVSLALGKFLDERTGDEVVFCTNAYDFVFDSNGDETYGILELIRLFRSLPGAQLIISDPSSAYERYLIDEQIEVPENVLLLPVPHSFFEVLKISDCLIRATTTDGDSLSVREALYLGKGVVASGCVSRPDGVITYRKLEFEELANVLEQYTPDEGARSNGPTGYDDIVSVYRLCGV